MVKITEKIKMDDLHEYKVMWSDADLEKLIEDYRTLLLRKKYLIEKVAHVVNVNQQTLL